MNKSLTRPQAAKFVVPLLDNPWGNPLSSMNYHINKGNLKRPLAESELKRFAKWLNKVNAPGGKKKQLPPDLVKLLGKISDYEIAAMTKSRNDCPSVSHNIVADRRKALGIPPFSGGVPNELITLFGKAPDGFIAELSQTMGRPLQRAAVRNHRHKLGIKAYQHTTGNRSGFHPEQARELLPEDTHKFLDQLIKQPK
jgi:hypothetical protein